MRYNNRHLFEAYEDLDGDGIETTTVNRYGAHFDLDANGFAESVGLVSADDGILVRT